MPEGIESVLENRRNDPGRFELIARLLRDELQRHRFETYLEDYILREAGSCSAGMQNRMLFYSRLVQREGKRLGGKEQMDALTVINEEFSSIVASVEYALSHDDASLLALFATNIAMPLLIQGKLELGASLFLRLLRQSEKTGDKQLEIMAGLHYGQFLTEAGKHDEARETLLHSLQLAEEVQDERSIAGILVNLGRATAGQGKFSEAIGIYEQALEHARSLDDKVLCCDALSRLGVIAFSQSRLEDAGRLLEESLELARETGYIFRIAGDMHNLANVIAAKGKLREAQRLYSDALALNRRIGNHIYETRNLMGLGRIAFEQGRFADATQLFSAARSVTAITRKEIDCSDCERALGNIAAAIGNYDVALGIFKEGIRTARKLGRPALIVDFQRCLGFLYLDIGLYEMAEPRLSLALAASNDLGCSHTSSMDAAGLALAALEMGELPDAVAWLIQSLELASESGRIRCIIEALGACVILMLRSDRVIPATMIADGVVRHMSRAGMMFGYKWHRDLDGAIASCCKLLPPERLTELEKQATSMSIQALIDFSREELGELQEALEHADHSQPGDLVRA